MKRSIAFLLAMIMVVGMIPATLLPVLAHGIGVGVNDVQNLSIDNAPNQKVPATVEVDGLANDTAWKTDEWEVADSNRGIWDSTPVQNENFTYRYQLHYDYEFVYGIIEWDTSKTEDKKDVSNFTVWINDDVKEENHYTSKIVLANGGNSIFGVQVFRYGSTTDRASESETFADWDYEKAAVAQSEEGTVQILEFKVFLADVLGEEIKQETDINLSHFVSAEKDGQRFYYPRVDAERDNSNVDLSKSWPDTAVTVTQQMIYADPGLSEDDKKLTYNNQYVTGYGVNIDGNLDESAWMKFTNYGASGYDGFRDYEQYAQKILANYDAEYSTEYRFWGGDKSLSRCGSDPVYYHVNDCGATFTYNDPEYTEGCIYGHINGVNSKNHVCTQECEDNYINNIPVKFKYNVKTNEKYIYGAIVASVNIYNNQFYHDTTNGYDTYFKVMVGKASSSGEYSTYTQLELKHTIVNASLHSYSAVGNNTQVLTAYSNIGRNSSVMPSGVNAYARRVNQDIMVFEFCISYDQLNANLHRDAAGKFNIGEEVSVLLTVSNDSSPATHTNPNSWQGDRSENPYPNAVSASSGAHFSQAGTFDALGRKNTHRYVLGGNDPDYTPSNVNGKLDRGIFNGLIATDRFINSAYHQNGGTTTVISNTMPAITTITGTEVNLATYSVTFANSGGCLQGSLLTWKKADGTVLTDKKITATKGVTKLTATSSGGLTQNIYIVAKNLSDPYYELYSMSVSDTTTDLVADGWNLNGATFLKGTGYALSIPGKKTVFLPEWLGDFGDYTFEAAIDVTGGSGTQWFSLVHRYQDSTHFSQFAVRVASSSSSAEAAYQNGDGWEYDKQTNHNISDMTVSPEEGRATRNFKAKVSGKNLYYSIDDTEVVRVENSKQGGVLTKGKLGITANTGVTLSVYRVKVTIPEVTPVVNSYGNSNANRPGATEFFDYDVFMDTEYLYGAAIVEVNGFDNGTKRNQFNSTDVFSVYINNGDSQWRDHIDYRVSFFLDPDVAAANSIKLTTLGTSYHSGYYDRTIFATDPQASKTTNKTSKGNEEFNSSGIDGIELKRTLLTDANFAAGNGQASLKDDKNGEKVLIEFKIPLELIGVSEKYSDRSAKLSNGKNLTDKEKALSYYVSVETYKANILDTTNGIVTPIPNNKYLARTNDAGEYEHQYVDDKVFAFTLVESVGAENVWGAWLATSYSGVGGANFIETNARTNTFNIDGVLDDVIWNDESERIAVDSYTGSWNTVPHAEHLFDYQYQVYTGREYIYGMAQINTVAAEGESLDFTLWINNNGDDKADKKFRIVQKGNSAVCYGINGEEIPMTYTETRWYSDHYATYELTLSAGKIAMTNDGNKTYVEFMFSLEALEIVLHELGEDKNLQSGSIGVDSSAVYPDSDKFYYTWLNEKMTPNPKLGFEYYVSVTKVCKDNPDGNTLIYPSVVDKTETNTTVGDSDKYCHLADDSAYNSKDRWDGSNAIPITPTGYYVPEAIEIDGDLSDSGWDDDRWIEVQEGVNGNLQNLEYEGARKAEYKYQIRVDHEYVYLAVVLDTPASPVLIDKPADNKYSIPVVKFWIKSKDEDYSINVNLQSEGDKEYTYENAISYTHLYDVSLGFDLATGKAIETTLNVDKSVYQPANYVTWEPKNVPHEAADKYVKLIGDLSTATEGKISYSGTALRFANHDTGFYAPNGGNARYSNDPLAALNYTVTTANGTYTVDDNRTSGGKYPTTHDATDYESSLLFGETKVIEENTITSIHPDGKDEAAYVDKDWYSKPEVKKYTYGNQHGVMTSDSTGTKTNVEFRFALSEIGCEDGDEFEYYIQGGTTGKNTDNWYCLYYPPINMEFNKTDGRGDANAGQPYCYWGTNAVVVDKAEREALMLNNSFGPVNTIGAQYQENYTYDGENYHGIKFGVHYNSDYIRQPAYSDENGHNPYINSTYWDVKEIGMLIGYTDWVKNDYGNLKTENVDSYNIYRIESDLIVDHISDTNMPDYENYVFYGIQLLWPEESEKDMKLTARGFVEYYPEDQIYYDMADKVFDYWSYSTDEDEGEYRGMPLTALDGVNGDPKKIPKKWKYRETYYSAPITRTINMIKYLSHNFAGGSDLPETNRVQVPASVHHNLTPIVYVPLDNRPVNLDRIQHQAEAAGFTLVTPDDYMMSAMLDSEDEDKSDQGNPNQLYAWLEDCFKVKGYKYYVISVDQMLSGGLVGSREPFDDKDDSIANQSSLDNFTRDTGSAYKDGEDYNGYTLSADETKIINLLKEIAESETTYTVYFDTIKRLACTNNYFDWDIHDYNALRNYGGNAPEQLYGNELTIENIVKSYTEFDVVYDADSGKSGQALDGDKYKKFIAARERKLRIAEALYPTLAANADTFYVGYDDSKPQVTMQTNDGRYIEEKLIKGSDNTYVFAGTDELGSMGIAKVVTHLYGSVSANVEFIGNGKDYAGDDYDTGTLYQNVMTHINGIGATYAYDKKGDIDILILTRADGGEYGGKYSSAQATELKKYAGQLIDRVEENLNNNRPTVVIDCAFEDGYLATMMMQRLATNTHSADISNRLGELLSYSHWGTTANSLGIAISNGVSRYSYLKNSSVVTDKSHQGAIKALVEAWVKDYGYRTGDASGGTLTSTKAFNSYKEAGQQEYRDFAKDTNPFANQYNDFWELTDVIMTKLNNSKLIVGVDKDGNAVIDDSGYRASVSNLGWRWDREHEANYDIKVEAVETFKAPDYNDQKVTNLALNKPYKTSWTFDNSNMSGENSFKDAINGEKDANGYYKGELTNGTRVYESSGDFGEHNKYWAGWSFGNTTYSDNFKVNNQRYFDITIDLGGIYSVYQVNLDQLVCELKDDGSAAARGIWNVDKVQLLTSTTDEEASFKLQRTLKVENFDRNNANIYRYYLGADSGAVNARYVKVRVWQDTEFYSPWFFCSEIEVLGLDGTRAEYVDSTGLFFTYEVLEGETPYNLFDGTDMAGSGYMTHDAGQRLRMYYDGKNYTKNMLDPELFFQYKTASDSGSNTLLSGWALEEGTGDEIPFTLDIDGDSIVTQVAVQVSSNVAGIPKPQYARLYMIDANGKETLIPTRLVLTKTFDKAEGYTTDGDKYVTYTSDGYKYIVEIANEGLYVPDNAKLKLCMGRESDKESNAYIFAGIQIIGRKGNVYTSAEAVAPANAIVKYDFIGDYADKAGFAQGIITVSPVASQTKTGYYLIYYTDANGVLAGYDEIASIPITGSTVSYEVPDGIMIPEGATGIAVFESDTDFKDNAPDIVEAVATKSIPTSKRISLGKADTIFAAASDIHVNYQYYASGARQAHEKWENALKFFEENSAEYVIISGDLTGDDNEKDVSLEQQYQDYVRIINDSGFSGEIYEALGNHGSFTSQLDLFYEYTQSGNDSSVHYPDGKTNSPYYYVVKGNNVFVFMYVEMGNDTTDNKVSNAAVFSDEQLNWLDETLNQFDTEENNVFVICHVPFSNYGAGLPYGRTDIYSDLLSLGAVDDPIDLQNYKFKGILQEHTDVIVMSGHTHLTLYENANYSDVNNEFAHTVHLPSTSYPRGRDPQETYNLGYDGRYSAVKNGYGSEAYLVEVYDDYIVYTGYNLATGKIIPAACIIIPTERSIPTPDEAFKGSGTKDDPYLIEDAQDFLLLTSGFNTTYGDTAEEGYGYGKYFLQTADIDLSGIDAYMGTFAGTANYSTYPVFVFSYRSAFSGIYNGNGFTITVDIDQRDSRSIFPYIYGALVNVTVEGAITSTTDTNSGGVAQPVRTVMDGGSVINCVFDLDLTARITNGLAYKIDEDATVYNVYIGGSFNSDGANGAVVFDQSIQASPKNVYYNYAETPDNVRFGTAVTTLDSVVTAFNDRASADYTNAMAKLVIDGKSLGIKLCDARVYENGIDLINGKVTTHEVETLFDGSSIGSNTAYNVSYAPYMLQDTSLFSDTVITEISFPFGGLASGYDVNSEGLYFPVYVVRSDLSSIRDDCTIENGKKILLDLTGKLDGKKAGDWVTVSGLNIKVGGNETLAFGDTDMVVIPQYKRDNTSYLYYNSVFTNHSPGKEHSLVFTIKGYRPEKKYISFLGDSITTYNGWSNSTSYNSTIGNNAVWYPHSTNTDAQFAVNQTWWYQAVEQLGYELCVNNSYSGANVLDSNTYNTRAANLHNTTTNISPDVVVIYMGINDCRNAKAVGDYIGTEAPPATPTTFSEAYGKTIKTIQDTYAGVEIYCCTVLPDAKDPNANNEEEFNAAIRAIANNMGATVIDLYALSGITEENVANYTVDKGLHPNEAGMDIITNVVVNAING